MVCLGSHRFPIRALDDTSVSLTIHSACFDSPAVSKVLNLDLCPSAAVQAVLFSGVSEALFLLFLSLA